MPEMPGRADYWTIGYPVWGALVYTMLILAAVGVGATVYRRYQVWRLGKPMPDLGPWGPRIQGAAKLFVKDIFGHRRFIKRELYPGLMHFFLFWGFTFLLIATTLSALEFNFNHYNPLNFDFPTARFRVQEDFLWDVFGGIFATIGLVMAALRRYIMRPSRLNTFADDTIFLVLAGALVATGFVVEGLRVAGTNPSPIWAAPVGYLVSLAFVGMEPRTIGVTYAIIYWTHVGIVGASFIYIAVRFSKISHVLLSPLNALLRSNRPLGALRPMGDIATLQRFGAQDLPDFTWKQLLDFDACTNNGRCQDVCPAFLSGKTLSPRALIQSLRAFSADRAPVLLAVKPGEQPPAAEPDMISRVNPTAVWDCLTCRACMEACPVFIEHIDSIVDMRRYLVMEKAEMPDGAAAVLMNMEQRGHPWRGTQSTRTDWMEGMGVKTLAEDPEVEVLLWVGCTPALNPANQRVPRAVASLLKAAGVKFGVLGSEETCSGDPARRLGNDYLFQTMAQQNIETFKRYNVKKVITLCPHCFNNIKNEYPQLGGNYQVYHYTEFMAELIEQGRLKPIKPVNIEMTYHDSCYLGR
ncbi:MAG: heterodisulfide reductase-related iron-sulfur binding cluster, partial [Dehalococcoidia bacterium]|nr:heterodisulfide reductase-related iron-sulfur binding cluster [Dehalococcoidia bacterium]